jgi:hypothetical protein
MRITRIQKGEIYWNSQHDVLPKLYAKLDKLEHQLQETATVGEQSPTPAAYWQQKKQLRTVGAIGINLLLEVCFEISMAFMSLYDFRKFLAAKMSRQKSSPTPPGAPDQNDKIKSLEQKMEQMLEYMASMNGAPSFINGSPGPTNMNYTSPPSQQKRLMGFNRKPDGNTAVATGSYSVATVDLDTKHRKASVEIVRLKQALKNRKSQYAAWAAKLKKGEGKDSTNERHMNRLQKEIADIEMEIRTLTKA